MHLETPYKNPGYARRLWGRIGRTLDTVASVEIQYWFRLVEWRPSWVAEQDSPKRQTVPKPVAWQGWVTVVLTVAIWAAGSVAFAVYVQSLSERPWPLGIAWFVWAAACWGGFCLVVATTRDPEIQWNGPAP